MPGMNRSGSGGPGSGRRCQGGQGRGMGQGQGKGQGRGNGRGSGQGRGQGMNNRRRAAGPMKAEGNAMEAKKVAVSSEGPTLGDRVDPRFGRAGGFAVVDLETMEVEYVDNGTSQTMAQGAGIQAAENVANAGAQVLLSGYVGPKAFAALEAAGIAVGQDVDGMTVGEAVQKFRNGEIPMAEGPNRQAGGRA
ncbi:NifB/NifX family molybdenum-iron cluster-binding protein [Pseudodesulfovibrio profundus]|nr:NifB/NifX family molybdenum-iron cluster-binding protein [Pseudodesulfovibrio profundus]|tara:strand:+ start:8819 stop:9394 length:576 start_codon:yes stop_codon:yes gene_type:complete